MKDLGKAAAAACVLRGPNFLFQIVGFSKQYNKVQLQLTKREYIYTYIYYKT